MQPKQSALFQKQARRDVRAMSNRITSLFWVSLIALAGLVAWWRGAETGVLLGIGALLILPLIVETMLSHILDDRSDTVSICVVFSWLAMALIAVWATGAAFSPLSALLLLGPAFAVSIGRYRLGVEASVFAAIGYTGVTALQQTGYVLPGPEPNILPGLISLIAVLQIGAFIAAAGWTARHDSADRKALQDYRSALDGTPSLLVSLTKNGEIRNWVGDQDLLGAEKAKTLKGKSIADMFNDPDVIRHANGSPFRLTPKSDQAEPLDARLFKVGSEFRMVMLPASADDTQGMQWVARLGHEMRNMINPLTGYADFMLQEHSGPLNEPYKSFAGNIKLGGEHLSLLIDDLMTATKSQLGQLTLESEELSLRAETESAIRLSSWAADASNVSLLFADGPDVTVHVDRKALRQILINLLSNAVKFSAEGAKVMVSVKPGKTLASVDIRDEGEGLSEAELDRIGEAFFRGENARGRVGTGLGLSIVSLLTNELGGHFDLQSQKGKGTTAKISLPVIETAIEETALKAEEAS